MPVGFTLPRRASSLGEVFTALSNYPTVVQKAAWLRHNDKPGLRYLLRLAHEPVEWVLPKGLPPFTPLTVYRGGRKVALKPGDAPFELLSELRRIYMFLKGGNDLMDRLKREKVFQEIIENLEPNEVLLVLALKDGTFYPKIVAPTVVEVAFPGWLASPFQMRFMR